jgi:hypothetical protein
LFESPAGMNRPFESPAHVRTGTNHTLKADV